MFWQMLWRCLKYNPLILSASFGCFACLCLWFIIPHDYTLLGVAVFCGCVVVATTANTVRSYGRMFRSLERRGGQISDRDKFLWNKTGGCFKAGRRAAIDHWKYLHAQK